MDTKNKSKNKNELMEGCGAEGNVATPAGCAETVLDSGSASSRGSKPGPKSSKGLIKGISNQEGLDPLPQRVKRKDNSPLLGAGKSIAPDKRRKQKQWKRLVVSDRDSGSELDSGEETARSSESALEKTAERAKRVARREEVIEAREQKEREVEENRPPSPELGAGHGVPQETWHRLAGRH